jgi:hypothetical protein
LFQAMQASFKTTYTTAAIVETFRLSEIYLVL